MPAMVVLAGLLAQPPGMAKAHVHHFHHPSPEAGSAGQETRVKSANPAGKALGGPSGLGVTPPASQSTVMPDKTHEMKPALVAKPENFPAAHFQPSSPIGRNAIGQPVAPSAGTAAIGEQIGPVAPTLSAIAVVSHSVNKGPFSRDAKIGQQNFRPIAGVNIPSHSKIDGAGLIRPSLAASGLGGPAKTAAGINGTAFRPKH